MMPKSPDQIYDELLVLNCQQGNRDAFSELVERWQKRLWHYALQVTRSESAAWDIVQETWVAIIKELSKLKDVTLFPPWTFRILNNKCADWLRQQQIQSRVDNQHRNHTHIDARPTSNDEQSEFLQAAIARLSANQRALLTLRYQQGFDISEIAEILGIPEGTVKSRLHRTVTELRQLIGVTHNE